MSTQPQTLSEVRALAEQSLGDPESSQHFLLALGVTPEAFAALDEQAQVKHLQQLQAGEQSLQGSVSNHSDQAAQAELLGQNQTAIAERAFEAYNFGEGVAVTGASGWEHYAAGHERSRAVYVEIANDDGKENSTTQLGFTVRFDPQTGALAEAYALDYKDQIWGSLPQGNLMKSGMTTDEFYSTLPAVERPVFDQSVGGFVIHAHPEIGVYPRSYEHCVQAFARSKGVALVDDEHVPPKGQGKVVNYDDLSSAELKLRGVALLSLFVTKAGLEGDVLSSYDKQLHLKELEESLRSCMENAEGYPNANFNGLAESVARCLVLYEEKPDVYARIVRGVCSSESEMFLDTFQGLLLLNTLQRGLADDHDYSFNAGAGTIERISEATAGNGLYPALLREILEDSQRTIQGNVQESVAPAVKKKFLVPTFVVVEADSKEAADDLVGNMQRDYLEMGVSLYLDETLPTVQVDASEEREFFTVLDEPEVMEAVKSFRPQNDSLSPGL